MSTSVLVSILNGVVDLDVISKSFSQDHVGGRVKLLKMMAMIGWTELVSPVGVNNIVFRVELGMLLLSILCLLSVVILVELCIELVLISIEIIHGRMWVIGRMSLVVFDRTRMLGANGITSPFGVVLNDASLLASSKIHESA